MRTQSRIAFSTAAILAAMLSFSACQKASDEPIWAIGDKDGSSADLALAKEGCANYMKTDFCYEDHFYVVGHSTPAKDFCYIIPGITDRWAGGGGNINTFMGGRNSILFELDKVSHDAKAVLTVDMLELGGEKSVVKVLVNKKEGVYEITDPGSTLELQLSAEDLIDGDNFVTIGVLDGCSMTFDDVRLTGTGIRLAKSSASQHLLAVKSTEYDLNGGPDKKFETPADYVDTRLGSGHSRPMIAPGPWMPFSLVKLSPDNSPCGWENGYQPTIESIGCMSHVHEWTMSGLGMMPTNGPLQTRMGDYDDPDSGYRSRFDKQSEKAPLGYYSAHLTDTDILLEATATTRCSFQRYTYPQDKDGRLMIDFMIPYEYWYYIDGVHVAQTAPDRLEGWCSQISPESSDNVYQDYIINFVMEFDAPIKAAGHWVDDTVSEGASFDCGKSDFAGLYVEFDTKEHPTVQVRTGMSFVSMENAALNLETEVTKPFGWDFEAVVQNQKDVWNDILERVEIDTPDLKEKVRFYTNLYRAMCRNTYSDVNGEWKDAGETVRTLADPKNDVALGSDAFWNTFWNLNQLWNLVTPEWTSRWIHSELAEYEACGYLSKGPAGMEYIPVMEGEHEIALIVAAWQMGIRDFDAKEALEAMVHQQNIPFTKVCGGFAGNNDIEYYLKYHYVPCDLGRKFSSSIEYPFDDWTVGQFAKALGEEEIYNTFNERGTWWKNVLNPENGYLQMRDSKGDFIPDFNPFSGYGNTYTESNGWQMSFFVPQDVPASIEAIGHDRYLERLEKGFEDSYPLRFNAPGDDFDKYPVNHGNQQSMEMAFLFNWAGRPDLTQKWSRAILDRYYGYGECNAYLGDEDQGQMSAWFVMAALGLFQTDGGCSVDPIYELASPLYKRAVIHLGGRYGRGKDFVIEAHDASEKNVYVKKAVLNGKELDSFKIPASEVLSGGKLELWMSDSI